MTLQQKLDHYRLNEEEYNKICEILDREPRGVEWALFSALWSEHCSYKSSKVHLKKFYSQNDRVVESFGENAGVIDLGEGERLAFKMESHNHPSFIEPYQGAATGVGGILRDIFTMGARPISLANYLCFGEPSADRMEFLVDGVVRGIGGYGNCVGVPTITGQTEFHSSYNGNILVNAMAVGLFSPGEKIFVSKAAGPGNYVVYVGAKTGKDGVHGASMASESFDEDSESKRPTVQIGDPFFEKLLIESCLEVMREDLVVAIQDMGAAGLTSSSFEMASKGGVGLKMHLDKVPLRDDTLTPEEILLSESQERMLLICEPKNFSQLQNIFKKWDLDAEVVGEVISDKKVQLYWHNEELCNIDPDTLVENAPMYERPYSTWQSSNRVEKINKKPEDGVESNLSSINGCSRKWIYEQYDQRVGAITSRDCQDSVAVQVLPSSKRKLGVVLGCRPHVMRMDAQQGGYDSIFYPAIELAAKGFEALAVTDCLNFGNPEKPEVMSEFVAAVEAMSASCEAIDAPVISGNVSFYNETLEKNVTSTPSIGMVGLASETDQLPLNQFKNEGDQIFLLRNPMVQSEGRSQEDKTGFSHFTGEINLEESTQFYHLVRNLSQVKGVQSTRLVGRYGLSHSLARMTTNKLGCEIEEGHFLEESSWTQENLYEVIVTVDQDHSAQFAKSWANLRQDSGNDQLWRIGEVIEDEFQLGENLMWTLKDLNKFYSGGWKKHFPNL